MRNGTSVQDSGPGPSPARVDHLYDGPAWFEGEDRAVHGQNIHRVHCAVPGCGADVRNIAVARKNHVMMHVRAASRLTNATGDAPVVRHQAPVTQKEVARRARLDVSSVNKILNGDVGPKFSEKTRARVVRIAQKAGYRFPPRGKKTKADVATMLILTAKRFLAMRAEIFPEVNGADACLALEMLEAAIAAAEKIWPVPADVRNAGGKAVGA